MLMCNGMFCVCSKRTSLLVYFDYHIDRHWIHSMDEDWWRLKLGISIISTQKGGSINYDLTPIRSHGY